MADTQTPIIPNRGEIVIGTYGAAGRVIYRGSGDVGSQVRFGENTYTVRQGDYGKELYDPRGGNVTSHTPQNYVEAGYKGEPAPPPNASGGSPTGVNSIYDNIPDNKSSTGIKVSASDSLTGGGRYVNDTGRFPSNNYASGVFSTRQGQLPAGSQLIVKQGGPAMNAAELIMSIRRGPFEPGRLNDYNPATRQTTPQYEVRVTTKRQPILPQDFLSQKTKNEINPVVPPFGQTNTIALPYDRNTIRGLSGKNSTDNIGITNILGGIPNGKTSLQGSVGAKVTLDFLRTPLLIDNSKDFLSTDQSLRSAALQGMIAKGGFPKFVAEQLGISFFPLADISYAYNTAKGKIANDPHLINIENTFREAGISNENIVNNFSDALPFNNYGKQFVRGYGDIALVAPSRFMSGNIATVRNNPEIIPISYVGGKLFETIAEGGSFFTTRYAALLSDTPFGLSSAAAGISKGVSALPYLAGGAYAIDVGSKTLAQPTFGGKIEYIGTKNPEFSAFTSGAQSSRGTAQQTLYKLFIRASGAKAIPAADVIPQNVLNYYEKGPDVPGAEKFPNLFGDRNDPRFKNQALRLAENKRLFEQASYLKPTYTQKVFKIPIENSITDVTPFSVQKTPNLVLYRYAPKRATKNYPVLSGTQAYFSPETTVLRGTSKQGGLYVSPYGQGSPFFLGLGDASLYESKVGLAGYTEPNFVKVGNIKAYSEELIPLFKKEGSSNTKLSDEFLRTQARPKTIYLEKRTYLGQTPEVQAVIPEGTPLKQSRLSNPIQKFLGFNQYTKIDFAGRGETIIPIRTYNALNKPSTGGVTPSEVQGIVERAGSYQKYLDTIDPFKSSGYQYARIRQPLFANIDESSTLSRNSSSESITPSTSSSSTGTSSSDNSLLSSMSSSTSYSIIPSSSSLSGNSSSIIPSSSSSIAPSSSISTSGLSSGSSLGSSGGSSSSSIIPRKITPGQLPDIFKLEPKRRKQTKKSPFNQRIFAYTPTFTAADLGIEGKPLKNVLDVNLAIRPVRKRKKRSSKNWVDEIFFSS